MNENLDWIKYIFDKDNIEEARKKVCANKGSAGIDGVKVEELAWYIDQNINDIIDKVYKRKYKPVPVKRVEIPKENGKKRQLGIPTVMDRVIQQAIVQRLAPVYENEFSDNSFGFRIGRSCEQAIIRALELINDGYNWLVDIDLERFFDTVNHDRLTNIISRTIKDGNLISLIRAYLDSGVMIKGKYEDTPIGTPQGGNLSPLLSNIMLNELDKELEARGLKFVRYADDCLILVGSKKAAERVMKSIVKFIEKKLGLKVNAEKSRIARPQDIKYLGFGFYYDEGKCYPRVHEKSIEKLKRKLKQLTNRSWSVSLDLRIEKINQVVRGWVNYFKICNMKTHMENISSHLRRRIRCIIWKQWKTPSKRRNSLMKLGISKIVADKYACSGNRYWKMSHTPIIDRAISNKRLAQRGLLCPIDQYNKVHIFPIG